VASVSLVWASEYRNLTLEQAFEVLEGDGLRIFYSSDLVKPWMRVRDEPTSADPKAVLAEITAAYGLIVEDGPDGSVLLVRGQAVTPPPTGDIIGVVRRNSDQTPVAGAVVRLDSNGRETVTDANGRFRFRAVGTGTHTLDTPDRTLTVAAGDRVDVDGGQTSEIVVAVTEVKTPDLAEIVVSASSYALLRGPAPSVTAFTSADLRVIPDIGDDPLRAVGRLPGTASNDFTAKANIRGGEVDETLVRFDGLRLYNPFHLKDFQSIFSAIDPGVIDDINIYTGGFPVRYGDRMSSVIDIDPLAQQERPYRELTLSFFNASGLAAGSFNDGDGDWLVSARRGNLDLIFSVLDQDRGEPSYIDLYGRVGNRFSDSFSLAANFLLFEDDVLISDDDQEERAKADYCDEYYWLKMEFDPSSELSGNLLLARTELESDRIGDVDQPGIASGHLEDRRSFSINSLQTDWSWLVTERLMLQVGGEFRTADGEYDYRDEAEFDVLFLTPGAPPEPTRTRMLSADPNGEHYAAYTNLRFDLLDAVTAEAGLRWDKETLSPENDDQISPRLGLLYRLGDETSMRLSWGRFFQAQAINELQIADGEAEFFPAQSSDHLIASFEHRHRSGVDIRLEAFRKDYRELRPRYENLLNTFILLPELKPDRVRVAPDRATVKGVELSLRRADRGPFSWWLNYTWSSTKDKFPGSVEAKRSWDQTHFVGAGVAWQTPRWEFSLAGTYHTGWPTTAVELAATDPIPLVATGPRNAERIGFYRAIDARIARKYQFDETSNLTVFLEINNVFNRSNDCCVEYEFGGDEAEDELELETDTVDSLPFFPSLGFIWRFRELIQ
jgi:outer membrane receptor protein involved in Fe transport